MRKYCLTTAVLALLFAAAFSYGKATAGVLDGVVLNGKGLPVAFADVFWQTADGRSPHAVHTNGKGYFRIERLSQGLYELRAQALGMTSEWEHNVWVPAGQVVSVTLRLTHPTARGASSSK